MDEITTPDCCEAWESWGDTVSVEIRHRLRSPQGADNNFRTKYKPPQPALRSLSKLRLSRVTNYKQLCKELIDIRENGTFKEWDNAIRRLKAATEQESELTVGPTQRQLLMLAEKFFPDSGYREQEVAFAREVLNLWG